MPAKSSLYRSSSALFDIDENADHVATDAEPQPRRVSIQAAPSNLESFDVVPVLGNSVDFGHNFEPDFTMTHTTNVNTQTKRRRTRTRRHSVSPWPICGLNMPVMVLRVLTSLVVIPLILAGLIWIPHVAVVWLCVLLVCVCAYEYAWLAFRIHYQLLSTYSWYERAPSEEETQDAQDDDPDDRYPFQSFASGFSNSMMSQSMLSFSVMAESTRGLEQAKQPEEDDEEDLTIGGEGGMAARAAKMVVSPLDTLEFAMVATAVSPLAEKWCGGREWLAKLMVATAFTPLWILAMHHLMEGVEFPVALGDLPGAVVFQLPQLTWIAVFVSCMLALSTPNLRFAASMIIQVNAFFAIAINSLACPILSIHVCKEPLLSVTEIFALGAVLVLALRGLTSSSPADMVLVTMVDLLGYLFVIGGFSLLVGVVDVHHDKDKLFARVLLLLVVVLWAAQIAAYTCDRIMSHFQLSRFRLLPRRIAVRVDLESLACAVSVGTVATAVGGSLVGLPTPVYVNIIFAFFAMLFARLGALFMSLLRRAAGVKRCSRVLPGFGGMLDMTSAVLFAAIAFSKLYTVVMAAAARVAKTSEERSMPVGALSVGFGGLR